jgi:hypothetical protein
MWYRTRASFAPPVLALAFLAGCNPSAPQQEISTTSSPTQATPNLPETARQMLGWLPGDNDVNGWTRAGAPRHFVPASLWRYIDGGAETYLRFNFAELVGLDYLDRTTGLEVCADLYRMDSPIGAFGVYAQELNPEATFLAVGSEGYTDGTFLAMWKGSYYLKLTFRTEQGGRAAALVALATETGRRIDGDAARPVQFDRFPTVGLVPRSFKVVPRDVFGQSYLAGGFEARYGSGDDTWTLTLVPFGTAGEAGAAMVRYRDFLLANGKIDRELEAPGEGGFVGQDSYYGTVVAARSGPWIAVALGPPSEPAGIEAVAYALK